MSTSQPPGQTASGTGHDLAQPLPVLDGDLSGVPRAYIEGARASGQLTYADAEEVAGKVLVDWTLAGTPAVTLPLFEADSGLPMGVQLIGRRGDDARLLRTARWLTERVEQAGGGAA